MRTVWTLFIMLIVGAAATGLALINGTPTTGHAFDLRTTTATVIPILSPTATATRVPLGINVAAEKPVVARAGGVTYEPWGNANDQTDYNTTTHPQGGRWGIETNNGNGTFQIVDLGAIYELNGVGYSLDWDGAFKNPLTFRVEISLDNETWITVVEQVHPYDGVNGSNWVDVDVPLPPGLLARYVRYSEPPDGEWNGWGDFFHLRAYSASATTYSPEEAMTLTPLPPTLPPDIVTGENLLANGSLDDNDFGMITNWSNTSIEPRRWYLVQNVPITDEENTQWVDRVDLSSENRGYGLRSVDSQNCNSYCSTEAVQIVPAQAGIVYTLSADARIEAGDSSSLYLDFLNANRIRLDVFTVGGYSTTWSSRTVTAQAPSGTEYIRVILYTSNAAEGIVYWDNIHLQASSMLPTPVPTATPSMIPSFTPTAPGDIVIGGYVRVHTTKGDTLNVRSGPGTEFAILERLPDGTQVIVLEGPYVTADFVWWRVLTPNDIDGWVVESADGVQTLLP